MSSLADLTELVGFFSYSRDDDDDSKGALSALRDRIQRELRGQLGRTRAEFRLWQDTVAIAHGTLWEEQIKAAIGQSVFFLPIITPTAVKSHHCKTEFELFLAREVEVGRNDLIFPILYVRVPALENEDQRRQNDVLKIIHARQYANWTTIRLDGVASSNVGKQIARFSEDIVEALLKPWVSPEERRRVEEAEAQRVAEEERQRKVKAESRNTGPNWDFFLSYSDEDQAFARWFENVLEAAGQRVFSQFNNMPPGSNFVREMQRGLERSVRLIALLSPAYVKSGHCQAECSAAYGADPGGDARKLVPFLIEATELPPLARQIVFKSLVGLSPLDATKAILEAVGLLGFRLEAPADWPGTDAIDRMLAKTGGIYEVAPGTDLRLEHRPNTVSEKEEGGHTPAQLFADAVSVVVRFSA
jgi:hypothetical protein